MNKAYSNVEEVQTNRYEILASSEGWTEIRMNFESDLDVSVVRFNMRGNDIYIEFGESGILQVKDVPIKFRARLVRERFIKLFFNNHEGILVTMPMF